MVTTDDVFHAARRLGDPYPEGWVLLLAAQAPSRLIVFVHGFRGNALETWQQFPSSGRGSQWWRASDMLFVSYDSIRDNIGGTAARLRRYLPAFYPQVPDELVEVEGARMRPPTTAHYGELYLVGHSLGGVVIRRALCDAAQLWRDESSTSEQTRPAILDAKVRLFSPASAGFRAAGWLALAQASTFGHALSMYLRRSSAYTDLLPGSQFLADTRRRTEALVAEHPHSLEALRASIVWANPDDVVLAERYDSDLVDDAIDDTNHSSVCKPKPGYDAPLKFVRTGTSA